MPNLIDCFRRQLARIDNWCNERLSRKFQLTRFTGANKNAWTKVLDVWFYKRVYVNYLIISNNTLSNAFNYYLARPSEPSSNCFEYGRWQKERRIRLAIFTARYVISRGLDEFMTNYCRLCAISRRRICRNCVSCVAKRDIVASLHLCDRDITTLSCANSHCNERYLVHPHAQRNVTHL